MSNYRGNTRLRLHDTLAAATLEDTRQLGATLATSMVEEFEFDAFNRLTGFRNGDIIATYSYNAMGLRQSKTVNGVETRHIWDGAHIVAETRGDGNVFARYFRGLGGELIFGHTNHDHFFYTFDGMGNVVGLFDNSSSLTPIADYRFDAFGNQVNEGNGVIYNPFRGRGYYWDEHSELYFLINRFMDPTIGRFITADPYWNVHNMQGSLFAILESANLYVYTINNPLTWVDPWGLNAIWIRDLANEMSVLFGSRPAPTFTTGNGNVMLEIGSGHQQRTGLFYFDGRAEVTIPGSRNTRVETIAENRADGRLYMNRVDFYRAMNISHFQATFYWTLTATEAFVTDVVIGGVTGKATSGTWSGAIIGAILGRSAGSSEGEYRVETTTAFVYMGNGLYDALIHTTVFWKPVGNDDFQTNPIGTWSTFIPSLTWEQLNEFNN